MSLNITKEVYLGAAKPSSGGGTTINNQDISVTENGTYTADEGYTGLGTVEVNVPTSTPEMYRVFENNNGVLSNSTTTAFIPLPESIVDISDYALYNAYKGTSSSALSGNIDLSSLQAINGSSACYYTFANCTGITSIDVSSLIVIGGSSCCYCMFSGDTGITSADFKSLVCIRGNSCCRQMFYNCTNLTSVNISKVARLSGSLQQAFQNTAITELSFNNLAYTATNINAGFQNMLQGCSNVTVHFPAEWQTDMASYSNVTAGFGGTNTTVLFDLPNVRTLDLTGIKTIKVDGLFSNFANNNYFPNITKVDLSDLEYISGKTAFNNAFINTTSITSVDVSKLTAITAYQGIGGAFNGCTGLTTMRYDSLKYTKGDRTCMDICSGMTGLTNVYFPALTPSGYDAATFRRALLNTTGVTIHFPSNMQTTITADSDYPNFSGTNTVVSFDLPATVILTGANTVEYERNPKYDTATALAWRVKDTGTAPEFVIDWTSFYTSGTTDPTVGATIYSDSACTTAVTTISSIA